MFNCHIHTFNVKYTPEEFIRTKVNKLPQRMVKLLAWAFRQRLTHFMIKALMRSTSNANIQKYLSFLYIGTMDTQDMIFENCAEVYPKGTRLAVHSINFQFMGGGKLEIPYRQQLDDLLDVRRKYPDTCLPFVFIDARMGDATDNLDFVAEYIAKGCVGIKVYPSLGYYPYDPRLEQVYQYAQENQLPLMVHCSRGGIHYANKAVPDEFIYSVSFNPKEGYRYVNPFEGNWVDFKNNFIKPAHWEQVLERFPQLKICFAHFGFDSTQDEDWRGPKNTWYTTIKQLMQRYENVYADISYTLFDPERLAIIKADMDQTDRIRARVLFGTDYFMTVQEAAVTEAKLNTQTRAFFGPELFNTIAVTNNSRYMNSKRWEFHK